MKTRTRAPERRPCFRCGYPVTPWLCPECAEVGRRGRVLDAPPIDRACQDCHRHGDLRHVGVGTPRSIRDEDAGGYGSVARRMLEDLA